MLTQEDDALEPGYIAYYWLGWIPLPIYLDYNYVVGHPVYYPYFEQDLGLGQNGIQPDFKQQDRPTNYLDINDIDQEIPNFPNANGYNGCDLINPISKDCTIGQRRDPVDSNRLEKVSQISFF